MTTTVDASKNGKARKPKTTDWDVAAAASATADNAAKAVEVESKTFTLKLPVKLTDAEMAAASKANGIRRRELDARKAAHAEVGAALRADEKDLHADVLLQEQGEALRDVECRDRVSFGTNAVDTIRLDTGEIAEGYSRALSFEDRQASLLPEHEDSDSDLFGDVDGEA